MTTQKLAPRPRNGFAIVAADRFFGGFFAVGALLHAAGSVEAYGDRPDTLLWALSGTLAGLLLAGANLLRTARPGDSWLAALCLFGCLSWIAIDISFGNLIGNVFDFRVLMQGATAAILAAFSARSLLARTAARA